MFVFNYVKQKRNTVNPKPTSGPLFGPLGPLLGPVGPWLGRRGAPAWAPWRLGTPVLDSLYFLPYSFAIYAPGRKTKVINKPSKGFFKAMSTREVLKRNGFLLIDKKNTLQLSTMFLETLRFLWEVRAVASPSPFVLRSDYRLHLRENKA